MRNLSLQDASAIGEGKTVVDGSESSPREQQMRDRRHDQQKGDRNKDVLIREFSLYPHLRVPRSSILAFLSYSTALLARRYMKPLGPSLDLFEHPSLPHLGT